MLTFAAARLCSVPGHTTVWHAGAILKSDTVWRAHWVVEGAGLVNMLAC